MEDDPLMAKTAPFLQKKLSNSKENNELGFGIGSAKKMWHYVMRMNIHCCLSVSLPPLDVWEWLEKSMLAYLIPLWSTPCLFYQIYTQISSQICNSGTSDCPRKYEAVLWGPTSIAAWVCHNLPQMYQNGGKGLWQPIWSPYGQQRVFSTKETLKFQAK